MSFFRRAGALIARFFTSAADPAAVPGELRLYSKLDGDGNSQLFGRSDDGTIYQITPAFGGAVTSSDDFVGDGSPGDPLDLSSHVTFPGRVSVAGIAGASSSEPTLTIRGDTSQPSEQRTAILFQPTAGPHPPNGFGLYVRYRDASGNQMWSYGPDSDGEGEVHDWWFYDAVNNLYNLFIDNLATSQLRFGTTDGRLSYDDTAHEWQIRTNGIARVTIDDDLITHAKPTRVTGPASSTPTLQIETDSANVSRGSIQLKSTGNPGTGSYVRWSDLADGGLWSMGNDAQQTGVQDFWIFDDVNNIYLIYARPDTTSFLRFGTTDGQLRYDDTATSWQIRTDGTTRITIENTLATFTVPVVTPSVGVGGASGPTWRAGTGDPNGVVAAPVGSMWSRTDVGELYFKATDGADDTGWTMIS